MHSNHEHTLFNESLRHMFHQSRLRQLTDTVCSMGNESISHPRSGSRDRNRRLCPTPTSQQDRKQIMRRQICSDYVRVNKLLELFRTLFCHPDSWLPPQTCVDDKHIEPSNLLPDSPA